MALRGKKGFTLIELMIALVVGGLLMAGLVGLAGSMRRAFGQSKDVTELQANLRFAMLRLNDDLQRVAFMYLAQPGSATDPSRNCHLRGQLPNNLWSPTTSWRALEYDQLNHTLTLRGNYSSTIDYLLHFNSANSGEIYCRDKKPYPCNAGGLTSDNSMFPFKDGQPFSKIFVVNQVFRMEAQSGAYTYHRVTATTGGLTFSFEPPVNWGAQVQGEYKWISPVTTVQYQVIEKPAGSGNWTLVRRRFSADTPGPDVEIAESLLPPTNDPKTSGFALEFYFDNSPNAGFCHNPWQPELTAPQATWGLTPEEFVLRARAVRVTIRARSPEEDPNFVLTNYDPVANPQALNYGYDLDGNPQDGLAYVRMQRTVVQLQNLYLNNST